MCWCLSAGEDDLSGYSSTRDLPYVDIDDGQPHIIVSDQYYVEPGVASIF